MTGRKSFIVFCDRINELEMLTDEECGKLFKGIVHYASDGTELETNSLALKLMFSVFKSQIDDNGEKYQKKKEANAEYYKKRKENKKNSENSENFSDSQSIKKNSASDTDTDTDTVTDTGTDTVTVTGTDTVTDAHAKNAPPSPPPPLKQLIFDYGQENVEKYRRRVENWYAEKGKKLSDIETTVRKWLEQDKVEKIDHSMDKYNSFINNF